jgi:hypothetical protein
MLRAHLVMANGTIRDTAMHFLTAPEFLGNLT